MNGPRAEIPVLTLWSYSYCTSEQKHSLASFLIGYEPAYSISLNNGPDPARKVLQSGPRRTVQILIHRRIKKTDLLAHNAELFFFYRYCDKKVQVLNLAAIRERSVTRTRRSGDFPRSGTCPQDAWWTRITCMISMIPFICPSSLRIDRLMNDKRNQALGPATWRSLNIARTCLTCVLSERAPVFEGERIPRWWPQCLGKWGTAKQTEGEKVSYTIRVLRFRAREKSAEAAAPDASACDSS